MSLTPLITTVAEASGENNTPNHWLIGAVALAVLLVLMGGLLAFGRGRDHT